MYKKTLFCIYSVNQFSLKSKKPIFYHELLCASTSRAEVEAIKKEYNAPTIVKIICHVN